MTIRVVAPVPTPPSPTGRPLLTGIEPGAHTIGIVDNGKFRAVELLVATADELVRRGYAAGHIVQRKPSSARPVTSEERAELLTDASIVLAGVGDCGSCSSCTVHDAVFCAELGIPSVAIITTPFTHLAQLTVHNLEAPDFPVLIVEHPLFTRDDDWIEQTANDLADQIVSGAIAALSNEPSRSNSC